ncbi:hypothetical protein HanRHA438_Chr11g0525381 [Helianthus annuus]|nr:hypothetical protein HanRHA438_Chr11g0525381 [Helianthus annuus]
MSTSRILRSRRQKVSSGDAELDAIRALLVAQDAIRGVGGSGMVVGMTRWRGWWWWYFRERAELYVERKRCLYVERGRYLL